MKKLFLFSLLALVALSCEKDPEPPETPTIVSNSQSTITTTSVTLNISLSNRENDEVGILYSSINEVPDITNSTKKTSLGNYSQMVSINLTGLNYGTKYYYRSYITNGTDYIYGDVSSFTTVNATSPIVSVTSAINTITQTSAKSGGSISSDGGFSITTKGICWNTTGAPTISNTKTTNGSGVSSFTSSLTPLIGGTTYYVRAYATNSVGTSYGPEISFTTNPILAPTVSSTTASTITQTTAISGGNATNAGGGIITARGICWSSATTTPTISNSKTTDGTGTGTYSSTITGLNASTTYYYCAYATNSAGTSYGTILNFLTPALAIPTISTTMATAISQISATSGGIITNDGGASITARGICWSTASNPTILNSKTIDGTGIGSFSSFISGLNPSTKYYYRAYATNSVGTSYGTQRSFTTSATTTPIVTSTSTATSITPTTAMSGGTISSDGGLTVTGRGVCWSSTTTLPTTSNSKSIDGTGIGTFTSSITGLTSKTTYYVRSYATNSKGTTYGAMISFLTP